MSAVLIALLPIGVLGGIVVGRRWERHDIDVRRAEVQRACEEVAAPTVALLLPRQRGGEL